MTIEDAKKIAHGLIQGYIGPDHRVMDMPGFTPLSCKRFKPPTTKAGMIAPKRQRTDEAISAGSRAIAKLPTCSASASMSAKCQKQTYRRRLELSA
jgi:hypothetical protein